jgi:hypothetical protein
MAGTGKKLKGSLTSSLDTTVTKVPTTTTDSTDAPGSDSWIAPVATVPAADASTLRTERSVNLLRSRLRGLRCSLVEPGGARAQVRRVDGVCGERKQDYRKQDRKEGEHLPSLRAGHDEGLRVRHGSSATTTSDRSVTRSGRTRNAAHAKSTRADDDAETRPVRPKSPTERVRLVDPTG